MITGAIRGIFVKRAEEAHRARMNLEETQRRQLSWLIGKAARTEWGSRHGYADIRSYHQYTEAVPITPYEEVRPLVMRMVKGERDILWPGVTRWFAQSSGTSDGRSKYIPITSVSLSRNHYRGGMDATAHYLASNPRSRLFDGRAFILGGSFANNLELPRGVRVGDLSATLIRRINPLVNLLRIPSKRTALMEDWNEKLPLLARAAVGSRVTSISGVPSWFLTVLKEVKRLAGKRTIAEVWPGLEVFFHGGISMEPYRELYAEIIGNPRMHYLENYNASEGFFAVQDNPDIRAMAMIVDAGVFYEFHDIETGGTHPAWEVEQGKIYSLIISACNGLWRYPIGDTVRIESTYPLRITIAGRTNHYINAFGEEVMVYNTDRALAATCRAEGCSVLNYTAAPLIENEASSNGRHQWIVEFDTSPSDLCRFAKALDDALRRENSDYDAKRTGDIFLSPLEVIPAPKGLFDRWLASTGKLGGQRKIPRLSNNRDFIDSMLKML